MKSALRQLGFISLLCLERSERNGHKFEILAITLATILAFFICACDNNQKADLFCSNCGNGISIDISFCDNCGNPTNATKIESSNIISSSVESKLKESSRPSTSSTKKSTPSKNTNKSSTVSHKHSHSKKVTMATCTEQGFTEYSCSCGDSYKNNYTNPSHTFSNYKCVNCGSMDKDNFYYYLDNLIKTRGVVNGEFMNYIILESNDNQTGDSHSFAITYDASNDVLNLNYLIKTGNNIFMFRMIIPKKISGKYKYDSGLYKNNNFSETALYCEGEISSENYTKNSAIGCNKYNGDISQRSTFIDFTR